MIKTVWTCDGCGTEVVVGERGTDWKRITVTVDGFKGYPVGDTFNGAKVYELCPGCQRTLSDHVNPRQWPRPAGVGSA